MEAIKKKVQAMKVEKDNLCDKCDEVEQVGFVLHIFVKFSTTLRLFVENEGGSAAPRQV